MDPSRRCTKRRSNGEPCQKVAIKGHYVCATHGGSAPQVRRTAREHLDALAHPAVRELERLLAAADSDAVKLATAKDILDRAGYAAVKKTDLTSGGQPLVKAYVGVDIERV